MSSPLDRSILPDPTKIDKLCFTSCCNIGFYEGALGLALSLRKFYSPEEADIVLFFNEDMRGMESRFVELGCSIQWEKDLDSWILPLVYVRPEYKSDKTHYYHPDWSPEPGFDHHKPGENGFSRIRHKHPLNIKAYCTAWCLVVIGYSKVVHIDSDAFILSKVDQMWARAKGPDYILGWDDGDDGIDRFETLFKAERVGFTTKKYTLNAGIVGYTNGPGIHRLMLDFIFYIESCYHYTGFGNDQGLLRALAMFHCQKGSIMVDIAPAACWNPTWFRADELEERNGEWFNIKANSKQFIWHGAGGEKLWTGKYKSASVNRAWDWVRGDTRTSTSFQTISGSLTDSGVQHVINLVKNHFGDKKSIKILEIGTQHGRTAVAFCELLILLGFDPHLTTLDIFAPSRDYKENFSQEAATRRNISLSTVRDRITVLKVDPLNDFRSMLPHKEFDFIYVDACHTFRNALADCMIAKTLLASGGIIIGDDLNLQSVKEAIKIAFGGKAIDTGRDQWALTVSD